MFGVGLTGLLGNPAPSQGVGVADLLYPNFPKTTLAQMRSVAGVVTSGTVSDVADTGNPYGQSTALQYIAGTTLVAAGSAAGVVPAVDVTNGSIRWNLAPIANWIVNNSTMSVLEIRLYSAGSPASPSANYHKINFQNGPNRRSTEGSGNPGRWQTIAIASNRATVGGGTGADLTKITYARIALQTTTGTATFYLGDIEFIPNPRTKAALIFRFDDAYVSSYNYAYPSLRDNLSKGGILCPGAVESAQGLNQNGRLTTANVLEMEAHGWQFGLQSDTTESSPADSAAAIAQITGARAFNRSLGLYSDGADGSYYSAVNAASSTFWPALAYMRSCMRFDSGDPLNPPLPVGETFPVSDRYSIQTLNGQTWSDGTTVTRIGNAITQAVTDKGTLVLTYHDGCGAAGESRDGFDAAVAYAVANPTLIEVTTLRDLLAPYLTQYGKVANGAYV